MKTLKKKVSQVICCCLAVVASGCGPVEEKKDSRQEKETLFTLMDSDSTGIDFVNTVVNQKDFNIFKYRNFYNGGGVAIGDINNDGLADIYLSGNMVPNKLYLNKGNFQFEDISSAAGVAGKKPWSTGVMMVDVNADGWLDIYVSHAGNNEGNNHENDLYINNGDLTFTERAAEFNLADTGFSIHASFFDYDKDGDLDAYILNNSNIPVSSLGYAAQREVRAEDWEGVPPILSGVGDMLLRNDGGTFTNVSEEAGIYGSLIGFGLGVLVTDINKDLYPDIYVTNDFYERDYLYINNQDGTFTEDIKGWTSHLSLSAMGVDMADINNDGHAEIFITEMLPEAEERVKSVMEFDGYNVFKLKQSKDFSQQYIQNTLQLNNGNGTFSEVAYYSGVNATDWSWAGLLFDMDNDGLRDIFVANGINHDLTDLDFVDFFANEIIQKMALTGEKESVDSIINKMPVKPQPNYAFRNNGDITFTKVTEEWGFALPSMSNGAAYGDLDNDGDLDLVVNNVNMETFVYKNRTRETTDRHYLKLQFEGSEKNPFAVGATALLYFDGQTIMQEQIPSRGFQSSMDYVMTIGLGNTDRVDSLRVIWPDNRTQKLEGVSADQLILLKHSESTDTYRSPKEYDGPTLLREVKNETLQAHRENEYNDFDYEGLIYKLLSQEGPCLAVGDFDGDKREDIFLGGAKGQPATLYRHLGNGNLRAIPQKAFEADAGFEDTAATFFDADGDGDLDLAVGSGGNEVGQEPNYRSRLYLNDGSGRFSRSDQELPSVHKNISVIAPHDFDNDGDTDLFVGSRSVVGIYGVNPNHLFLENDGKGNFSDATERVAYDLQEAGMITDAIWADTDGDGKKDLVTVGDWASPAIYRNNGRRLSRQTSELDSLHGWWNTVVAEDLDKDGDLDLILGNQGENLHYKPSPENPMKMWVNDFDNNGTIEQVITLNSQGADYPLHQKRELTTQMSALKKQNLKASEYSRKTIGELFPEDVLENALMKQASHSQSVIAINTGEGTFTIKELPARAQLSCICGISCADVNGDGFTDLILGGNNFEFKPQFSRLDANFGSVLLGGENLEFKWQDYSKSGFMIRDEIKHLKTFKDRDGKTFLLAAINNQKPRIFALDE